MPLVLVFLVVLTCLFMLALAVDVGTTFRHRLAQRLIEWTATL
jgi:hypothetical protein